MVSSTIHYKDKLEFQLYRIRRMVYLRSVLLFLFSLGGTVVSIGILIWQWRRAILSYGPAALLRWITIPAWGTVIFSTLAIISFIFLRQTRQSEVQVSSLGLTIQKGKDLHTLGWDSVVQIWTNIERYGIFNIFWAKRTEIHLKTKDGSKYKFNQSYERIDGLIEAIKHFVYPKLLQEYRLAFNRGEPITFGPLVLTSDGILNGREALRWKDLGTIRLENGSVKLYPFENGKSPRLSVPSHKIPNIDLCIQLINHLSPQS